jgi:hypothetical protein
MNATKALFAALLVTVSLGFAASGSAADQPSLRVTRFAPLTVVGRGFPSGEHVTVSLFAGQVRTLSATARSDGGFSARFAARAPKCTAWVVRAVGSSTGTVSLHSPTAGCSPAAVIAGPPPSGATGVAGLVMRGPITPVCASEVPCSAPAAGVVVQVLQGATTLARVTTGKDGKYYVALVPGSYVVSASGRGVQPQVARVQAGRIAEADFMIDTGIR